jgi:hypothetical protein
VAVCVSLATGKCSGNDGAEACTIGTAMRSGIERGRRGGGDQLEGEIEHMIGRPTLIGGFKLLENLEN